MAWQLNFALLAANAGLFAAANTLPVFDSTEGIGLPLAVVLLVGALINLVGFFVLQRSKIHRLSRLFRAYSVEDALAQAGHPIQTFTSAERHVFAGRMLVAPATSPPPPKGTRPLKCYEKIEVLDLRFAFNVSALAFLALGVWVIIGRPWL